MRLYVFFPTAKVISKTGLADEESRHLGMEDQDLPTIPTQSHYTDTEPTSI